MPAHSTIFAGRPVEIRYERGLRDAAGREAHASTFIPQRLILLSDDLRKRPEIRQRILLHEMFHFVWVRLGNPRRREWEEILQAERRRKARGEAGWSAELRKNALTDADAAGRTRRWREYCCESFCDTGSWVYGASRRNTECTLAARHLARRAAWFGTRPGPGPLDI